MTIPLFDSVMASKVNLMGHDSSGLHPAVKCSIGVFQVIDMLKNRLRKNQINRLFH
jgi:hypothetical protein